MKNALLVLSCAAIFAVSSCSKNSSPGPDTNNTTPDSILEAQIITDFVNVVANPNYVEIQAKAGILKDAVAALIANPTDVNLQAARQAWKDTRAPWESCEGFLFGPVEDNDYDPTMDSWPLNKADVDNLLASSDPLSVTDIDKLDGTAKGFHAIEYIIFGVGGTKKAADITAREKLYLAANAESLYNTTTELRESWDATKGNFSAQVLNAGKGSTSYGSRQDFFVTLAAAMEGICDEVGTGKMDEPYVARDSTLDESSYSHNSTIDFKNNITGIQNVYLCQYNGVSGSVSLSTLVSKKNAALDAKIRTQISTAIASFATITHTYEQAIYDQRAQIKATQDAIAALDATLKIDLDAFIRANVKD